jgi:hypothetical protein
MSVGQNGQSRIDMKFVSAFAGAMALACLASPALADDTQSPWGQYAEYADWL